MCKPLFNPAALAKSLKSKEELDNLTIGVDFSTFIDNETSCAVIYKQHNGNVYIYDITKQEESTVHPIQLIGGNLDNSVAKAIDSCVAVIAGQMIGPIVINPTKQHSAFYEALTKILNREAASE